MKQDFGDIELSGLVDLLALCTSKYTYILREGNLDDDLQKYEGLILLLQNAIKESSKRSMEAIGNSEFMPASA
jgi:hypothetical protein